MDMQLQTTFPQRLKNRQLCHYHERTGAYVKAYVSCVFDGGFEITKKDGTIVRYLEARWDETDATSLLWLTKRGRPIKKRLFSRF